MSQHSCNYATVCQICGYLRITSLAEPHVDPVLANTNFASGGMGHREGERFGGSKGVFGGRRG